MDHANPQVDWEELSAWMDGELPASQAQHIAALVQSDKGWAQAHRQLQAVNAALDLLPSANMPRDLTGAILRSADRRSHKVFVIRVTGAAAAACLVAGLLWALLQNPISQTPIASGPSGLEARIASVLKDVPPEDRFIVQNLPLFKDYEQVGQYEKVSDLADAQTLTALEELEKAEDL